MTALNRLETTYFTYTFYFILNNVFRENIEYRAVGYYNYLKANQINT